MLRLMKISVLPTAELRVSSIPRWAESLRLYSSGNESDEFLHKSKIPTMHFQPSLPRLPIPPLEKTCQRYINALTPLLDNTSLANSQKLISDFQSGIGKELDTDLRAQDKANKQTSYITEPWFDMYLRDRQSIVLNYNPFIGFIDDPRPSYNDQTIRATNFLISSLRFMKTLRAGILEPEVYHLNPEKSDNETFRNVMRLLPSSVSWYGAYLYKAFPLDMSQYSSLFNSTRVPEIGKDRIVQDESAKHVLVMRKGHFYVFDALDKNGNILSPADLHACVSYISKDPVAPAVHPLGYLTSENRDTWARVREVMVSQGNGDQLKAIDSSLFNLVLDDVDSEESPEKLVHTFLHGDGANRWFDKSFSLILTRDGKAAVNFEHSWGDGVAVMRFFNEVYKDSTTKTRVHPDQKYSSQIDPSSHVRRLEFQLSDEVKSAIDSARQSFDKLVSPLNVDVFQYDGLGKNLCKKYKVSPDAIMQLGFQVAFHRLYGKTCASYESCSTAAFKHGRTETIRPCTVHTKAFSEALSSSKGLENTGQLKELINKCSTYHGQLTKEAAMGEGFDRHLFGLKIMAQKKSANLPAIYADPAYSMINHNVLSTSTLSSPAVLLGGFAPVVQDGFGLGYAIQDERLGAVVTTYKPHRNGKDMAEALDSTYRDIKKILQS